MKLPITAAAIVASCLALAPAIAQAHQLHRDRGYGPSTYDPRADPRSRAEYELAELRERMREKRERFERHLQRERERATWRFGADPWAMARLDQRQARERAEFRERMRDEWREQRERLGLGHEARDARFDLEG